MAYETTRGRHGGTADIKQFIADGNLLCCVYRNDPLKNINDLTFIVQKNCAKTVKQVWCALYVECVLCTCGWPL